MKINKKSIFILIAAAIALIAIVASILVFRNNQNINGDSINTNDISQDVNKIKIVSKYAFDINSGYIGNESDMNIQSITTISYILVVNKKVNDIHISRCDFNYLEVLPTICGNTVKYDTEDSNYSKIKGLLDQTYQSKVIEDNTYKYYVVDTNMLFDSSFAGINFNTVMDKLEKMYGVNPNINSANNKRINYTNQAYINLKNGIGYPSSWLKKVNVARLERINIDAPFWSGFNFKAKKFYDSPNGTKFGTEVVGPAQIKIYNIKDPGMVLHYSASQEDLNHFIETNGDPYAN